LLAKQGQLHQLYFKEKVEFMKHLKRYSKNSRFFELLHGRVGVVPNKPL
jgi:hypothetical protein